MMRKGGLLEDLLVRSSKMVQSVCSIVVSLAMHNMTCQEPFEVIPSPWFQTKLKLSNLFLTRSTPSLPKGLGVLSLPFSPPPVKPNPPLIEGIGGVLLLDIGGVAPILLPLPALEPEYLLHHNLLPPNPSLAFSSRRRSKADRYRSYPSLNDRLTRDEKMSSPRGLEVGGIAGIMVGLDDVSGLGFEGSLGGIVGGGGVEERRKGRGMYDRMDGLGCRMFKCIFKGRSALLE
jgi:hypothetical protein